MKHATKFVLVSALLIGLVGCAKKQEVKPEPPPPPPPPPTETQPADTGPVAFTPADLETNACLRQRTLYFDFDQALIRPEFQDAISCHAKYLNDRPNARVTLQGNADERGSREYNLGLGERRAQAVERALEAAGASSSQIEVVSYGEERPVCQAHSESCWQKNRRVDIVYTVK